MTASARFLWFFKYNLHGRSKGLKKRAALLQTAPNNLFKKWFKDP